MNCPICGEECEIEEDHMEHILLEHHDICPNKHWGRDFVTGSECEWFTVDSRTSVEYGNNVGQLWVMVDDGELVMARTLDRKEIDGYLYIAKTIWNYATNTKQLRETA